MPLGSNLPAISVRN